MTQVSTLAATARADAHRKEAVTTAYARFALGLRYEDIPEDVRQIAREQILATTGSCLAGTLMPASHSIERALQVFGGQGPCTLFGARSSASAPAAALYNAATAQIIEWDDWVIISHTGACVIPTAFAVGEMASASGKEVITAVVIGNEINARTSRAIQRGAYVGNSMPNHQVETALVAARLNDLDETAARRAVSHSCFLAMESCPIGWMSDSKALCNGQPAFWGILSSQLAKEGLVGNPDMVEHPGGFLQTVSEHVDYAELTRGLGQDWHTRTLNTKRYPSCAYNLAAIECAIELHRRLGTVDAAAIERIDVHGPGVMLYVAARFQALEPDIYTQIRNGDASHVALCFDASYGILAALADGTLSHKQYVKDRIFASDIDQLKRKIHFHADQEMHAAYYADYQYGARMRITLTNGQTLEEERRQIKGARDNPFDHADKFREGASGIFSESRTEQLIEAVRHLERYETINEVGRLFRL